MAKFIRLPFLPSSLRTLPHLLVLAAAAVQAGCGNLTAGGVDGEVELAVSGDVPAPQSLLSADGPNLASDENDQPEGEVEVEFRVFLQGANGRSVPLSSDDIRVRVDLRGRQEADVVIQQVPSIAYDGLLIVFTEIKAEVDSGLVINGQVVSGEVRVEMDDTTLTVLKPLSLEIGEGERVQLLIDLNSGVWLQAVNPDLQEVAEEFFADALTLIVR